MGENWIKVRNRLLDEPEVQVIIDYLDGCGIQLDEYSVVGRLVKLWAWADEHLEINCNDHVTDAALQRNGAGVTTKWVGRYLGCECFAEAMAEAGWLVITEGKISFPNIDRHITQSAKQRGVTAKRVKRHREKICNGASVTPALPELEKEKEREYKNKTPSSPLPVEAASEPKPKAKASPYDPNTAQLPACLDTPAFRSAWVDWFDYRRERRLAPWKSQTIETKLAELAEWGPLAAVDSIRASISNAWQGLFPPKAQAASRPASGLPEMPKGQQRLRAAIEARNAARALNEIPVTVSRAQDAPEIDFAGLGRPKALPVAMNAAEAKIGALNGVLGNG